MMEKKRILEEGLLEQYLSGELSPELHRIVEEALHQNSEVREHFDLLEADFERMGMEQAVVPPAQIKKALVKSLEKKSMVRIDRTPIWIAASIAILFGIATLWMFTKWQNAAGNLKVLQEQTAELQERMYTIENNYFQTSLQLRNINNPNVVPLVLYGNQKSPNAKVVAYMDHKRKAVIVNPQGLPVLPTTKTYQMWSDVDGEMIDMGILSPDEELVTLKYIDKAESLNITIEPAGGNDHPTVEELISFVLL